MKYPIVLIVLIALLSSCGKEESVLVEATIEGRWQLSDLETVRYEFTADKRYTIYQQDDGAFPSLLEFQNENPNVGGHEWYKEGELIVIDLNFGNYFKFTPSFKCDNMVVDLVGEDGIVNSSYHREQHDISSCN